MEADKTSLSTARFEVPGLCCANEAAQARRALAGREGVVGVRINLVSRRVTVDYDTARIREADLAGALSEAGLEPGGREAPPWPERNAHALIWASGLLVAAGVVAGLLSGSMEGWWARPFFLLAVIVGAATYARSAWSSLLGLRPDMNLLMSIAIVAALGIGEWFEAGTIAFLFALAEEMERSSMDRARRSIESLLDLEPAHGRRLREGVEERVPVEEIAVGEILVVRPGERVPLDGAVTDGASFVDESPITGESMPVEKGLGEEVFAGSVNGDGLLHVEVLRRAGDTTLDRILHLVEQAQSADSPAQRVVERFARVYTPAVLGLAVVVFLAPPLLLGAPWAVWFYRAVVLLVISCPCALVLSTPVSIVSALAAAARSGVLIKGGVFLEEAARLRGIAFDKTGTLTTGRVEVAAVHTAPGVERDELLALAASLERYSEHPFGEVILEYCRGEGVEPMPVEQFQTVPGRGVRGTIGGRAAIMGSSRLLREEGVDLEHCREAMDRLAEEGNTLAVAALEGRALGCLALRDGPRPEAAAAVADLKRAGIERLFMLTGDNPRTAAAIGEAVGIEEIEANLLPEDKMKAVRRHRQELGHLAMVGDGINDAPALAASSLGVAMGTAGSDAALETADAALMADDLSKMVYLVRLGRRTVRTIRFNIAFALVLKGLFVVLALSGLATLWMAVGADMGASLLVILNGLRLLGYRHAGRPIGSPESPPAAAI